VKEDLHSWHLTPKEAVALQRHLRQLVHTSMNLGEISRLAGVDVAYLRGSGESVATVAVLQYPELQLIDFTVARVRTPFPYIPGLLSFREMPPILEAFRSLSLQVDIVFVDGHGLAHPRRMGIASHLGLWLEKPTIGIGKSRLCGEYQEPGSDKGCCAELWDKGEVVGQVLRTRSNVKPIFVSVGYGIPLEDCVEMTLRATPKYRLPEPIRIADRLAAQNKTSDGAPLSPADLRS
jgi:deoxyribonuclease V